MKPTALVVTSVHPPDDPRIRYRTIGTLLDDGWQVRYVCPAPGPTVRDSIDVRLLTGSRIARSLQAIRAMVGSRPDVTVIHDPELLIGAVPLALARGRRRYVFDLHENLPGQLRTRRATPRTLRRLTAAFAAGALRVAERSMTITLAEEGYRDLFSDDHPVFENLPAADSLPMRRPDATGIVYVGDVTRERGAVLLLDAVARLDRVPLTLIGRCRPSLAEELRAGAASLGVELTMTGYLEYGEAWNRAASALVGVSPLLDLPNYRHSLPTKIYEYRSVGLVTVASDLPGSLPAVEGSSAARTFTAGDVDSLANTLRDALTDPTAAKVALEEAPDVRRRRSWDRRRFAAFYRELVTSSP